ELLNAITRRSARLRIGSVVKFWSRSDDEASRTVALQTTRRAFALDGKWLQLRAAACGRAICSARRYGRKRAPSWTWLVRNEHACQASKTGGCAHSQDIGRRRDESA